MSCDDGAPNAPNCNYRWTRLLLERLQEAGVESFCIAPGSRNTPLTLAAADLPQTPQVIHFDERALAFYALGRAKATGKPVALICTSGTAAANFLPAVVEASMSLTPLLLLTADRPHELLDCGANQAIDQRHLFGRHVRWYCELPCPEAADFDRFTAHALTAAAQALYRATRAPAGPVHLNCMFREPLAPAPAAYAVPDAEPVFTRYYAPEATPSNDALAMVAETVAHADSGVLVVGRLASPEAAQPVRALAEALGWPVLPDIGSGLRLNYEAATTVPYYDRLLASGNTFTPPRCVLHIGGAFVSKALLTYLAQSPGATYVHVDNHPFRHDPAHCVTERIEAEPGAFARALRERLGARTLSAAMPAWKQWSARVGAGIDAWIAKTETLTEIHVARIVSRALPPESVLFLGNSMPIRDMDMFAAPDGPPCVVVVNRGASGIDGNLATALGAAHASGKPATAIVGDLTALHDLNAMALAKETKTPFVLIVINNDGGGIFSFLPVAEYPEHFESHVATPHGIAFKRAAALFGVPYAAPASPEAFTKAYARALGHNGVTLIEVRTNRHENRAQHQRLTKTIAAAMKEKRRQ